MEEETRVEEQGISLRVILYLIKRNILLILLVTFGATLVAAIYGFGFKPYTYTSTATALCEADVSSVGGTNEYSSYSYSVYLTNTFKDFITSQPVLDGAKEILDNIKLAKGEEYPTVSTGSIKNAISIEIKEYSVMVFISCKTSNQELSADMANAVLQSAQDQANQIDANTGKAKYQVLYDKLKIVERAKIEAGSRGALTVCLIGFAVGIVLSFAIIIIKYLAEDTYRSKDEFEKEYKINILASIPDVEVGGNK